jgi:multimeric flavodoxin WrbA
MNIVTIFGGPRPQGNTATILGWVEDALREKAHSVERFNTSELEIKGCQGCYACAESMDEPGCVLRDDAQRIFEAMIRADAVVHASPLYMWSLSGQLKPFLDRTLCLVKGYGGPSYKSLVAGKKTALLMTCMGQVKGNAEWAREQFAQYAEYQKYELIEPWIVPGCSTPDELTDEVKRRAAQLAARLVA